MPPLSVPPGCSLCPPPLAVLLLPCPSFLLPAAPHCAPPCFLHAQLMPQLLLPLVTWQNRKPEGPRCPAASVESLNHTNDQSAQRTRHCRCLRGRRSCRLLCWWSWQLPCRRRLLLLCCRMQLPLYPLQPLHQQVRLLLHAPHQLQVPGRHVGGRRRVSSARQQRARLLAAGVQERADVALLAGDFQRLGLEVLLVEANQRVQRGDLVGRRCSRQGWGGGRWMRLRLPNLRQPSSS